jgi:hypothetical protein
MVGGIVVDATANPALRLPTEILVWAMNEATCRGDGRLPEGFQWPAQGESPETAYGFASRVSPFALQYYLFHELAHAYFRNDSFLSELEEERACDLKAAEWMMAHRCADDEERRDLKLGMVASLLYVAVRGIDTGEVDGIVHPRCYDRLVNTLESQFDRSDSETWGFVTAILAVHATNRGIDLHDREFNDFYPAVLALRDAIHERFVQGGHSLPQRD